MATHRGQQRDKPFRDALRMQIADADGDMKRLRKIADALLAKGDAGDVAAIKEIADRLDGKVAQPIGGADDLPPLGLETIERRIVDPDNRDG